MRRLVFLLAAALVMVPTPARAQAHTRVGIVWVEQMTFSMWRDPALANLSRFLDEAAIGLVSTRTEREVPDANAMRANAAATISAGARSAADPSTLEPIPLPGVTPDVLAESLSRAGVSTACFAPAVPCSTIVRTGTSADASGDVAVYDAQGSLETIDDVAAGIMVDRPPGVFIILSATPTVARQRDGVRLAPIAIVGPGFESGLLTSGTTRRAGVVSLIDIAPTILDILNVEPVAAMDGRVITSVPRANAIEDVARLEADLVHAATSRRFITRRSMIAAMLGVVLALLFVLFGLGAAAKRGRLPARARDWVQTLLIACAALPLSMYLEGAWPTTTKGPALVAVAAFAVVLAFGARAVAGGVRALAFVMLATAAVMTIDIALGSPLGHTSSFAFQIAIGGRFFGVDEGILGSVIGASVCGTALALDRLERPRRAMLVVAAGLGVIVFVLGAPLFGSKFGAPLTAVPAFGVLAVRAGGRRLDLKTGLAIAVATIAITASFVAADALRAPESQTHLARAATGQTDLGGVISRKIEQTLRITFFTIWSEASLVFAAAIGALLLWRRQFWDRGMWGRPHLRGALVACGVGAVCGVAFNDGGVIAAAPTLLFAATAAMTVLIAPER